MASANLFPLLGVERFQGHTFLPEEDRAGGPPVALLSYGLWQRRFSGARDVLGKDIILDNQTYTINRRASTRIPVPAPGGCDGSVRTVGEDPAGRPFVASRHHRGGAAEAGVSGEQARADMEIIGQRLAKQYPVYDTDVTINVFEMHDQLVHECPSGAARPAECGGIGAADRLRQCGKPAARAGQFAAERNRHTHGDWRGAHAHRAAVADGKHHPLLRRRGIWSASRVGDNGASASSCRRQRAERWPDWPRWPRAAFHAGPLRCSRELSLGSHRRCRTAKLDLRAMLNEADAWLDGRCAAPAPSKCVGGNRGRAGHPAAHRRGASAAQLRTLAKCFSPASNRRTFSFADVPLSPQAYPQSPERMAFFDRSCPRTGSRFGPEFEGPEERWLCRSAEPPDCSISISRAARRKSPRRLYLDRLPAVSPGYLQTLGVPSYKGGLLTEAGR